MVGVAGGGLRVVFFSARMVGWELYFPERADSVARTQSGGPGGTGAQGCASVSGSRRQLSSCI